MANKYFQGGADLSDPKVWGDEPLFRPVPARLDPPEAFRRHVATNPFAAAAWHSAEIAGLSREDALTAAAVALAEQNERLEKRELERLQKQTGLMFVTHRNEMASEVLEKVVASARSMGYEVPPLTPIDWNGPDIPPPIPTSELCKAFALPKRLIDGEDGDVAEPVVVEAK